MENQIFLIIALLIILMILVFGSTASNSTTEEKNTSGNANCHFCGKPCYWQKMLRSYSKDYEYVDICISCQCIMDQFAKEELSKEKYQVKYKCKNCNGVGTVKGHLCMRCQGCKEFSYIDRKKIREVFAKRFGNYYIPPSLL